MKKHSTNNDVLLAIKELNEKIDKQSIISKYYSIVIFLMSVIVALLVLFLK